MSIKIHHGPPGSYKTSGALGDDFLREAKAGRVIVTNVRGLTRERVLEEFPDLPESFDVVSLDTTTLNARTKLANWFHWVPKGAFLFIDEAQLIWPRSWRESDIRALDYPGGVDKAAADDRPANWEQAWDQHRHWNWDFVLTTPQYKKIRDDIKGVADGAYKHKDLALIGWTGRYIEGFHMADDSGESSAHFMSVNRKKVPAYVFKLYDSTATGQHSGTKSGLSILKNPRVAMLMGVLVVALAVVVSNDRPAIFGGSGGEKVAANPPASPKASPAPAVSPVASLGPSGPAGGEFRPINQVDTVTDYGSHVVKNGVVVEQRPLPFGNEKAEIVSMMTMGKKSVITFKVGSAFVTDHDYKKAGYAVEALTDCYVRLTYGQHVQHVRCVDTAAPRPVPIALQGGQPLPQLIPGPVPPPPALLNPQPLDRLVIR